MERGERVYQSGEVIFSEGDYGSAIYKLLSGSAEVYAKYGDEEEKLLTELHEGDYFGEMAVIEITRRSATVVAGKDGAHVEMIDASDLSGYLSAHRGEINGIARHLSRRLRELTDDYIEVCDTLRELGRLDTSADRVSEGLMARIKKFARIYLLGDRREEPVQEPPETRAEKCDRALALRERVLRKGDVVFREGDRADCMYYIHEGRVGVYTGYGTDRQKLLTELTPEMFFGEMGLFESLHRTATIVALEDDTVAEIIRERDLDTIFAQNPTMALMVLQHLSGRLRRLTRDYLKACKTLAETEEEIEATKSVVTAETLARAAYMNQLLLAPEVIY